MTPLGHWPFFIEFLKVSGLFAAWVADCPLTSHSNHASDTRAVLATLLLSILAGHRRDAPSTAIRQDSIPRSCWGSPIWCRRMRRALTRIDESSGVAWLDRHLAKTTQPLLTTPWLLDLDATVKCLDGKQEGAVGGTTPRNRAAPRTAITAP